MLKVSRILIAAVFFIAAPGAALAARGYATNNVNMHAGPGVDYPVVSVIPAGADVYIHGCLGDDSWCDVSWDSDRGWVAAAYLDYFYNDRYVYLPDYFGEIDVPVVTFSLGTYWGHFYAGRPWYHRRAYWRRYWHHHRTHFVRNPHYHHRHRFAGNHHHHFVHNNRTSPNAPTLGGIHHRRYPRFAHHHNNVFTGRDLRGHHRAPHFAIHHRAPRFAIHHGQPHFAMHHPDFGPAMRARARAFRGHIGGGHGGTPHIRRPRGHRSSDRGHHH